MINQLVDMVEKRQVAFSLQSNFEMMAKDKTCKTNAKDTILFVQILWWPCPLAGFSLYMVVFRINKANKYRKFGFRKYTHRIHAWYSFLDLVDLHWQICTIHGPYEIVICPDLLYLPFWQDVSSKAEPVKKERFKLDVSKIRPSKKICVFYRRWFKTLLFFPWLGKMV